MSDKWTVDRIPDQSGRVALVTGANSGLGLIAARELARAGARVVLACRNMDKGATALRERRATVGRLGGGDRRPLRPAPVATD
jgi:NAD(P)-dependent dehydrogenase (short-subunit alcohol dehydrogenase family)